jgi:hypothetical protein
MWGFIVQINIGCCNWFCKKELEPYVDYIIIYKDLGGKESILYSQDIFCKYMCFGMQMGEVQLYFVMTHIWLQMPLIHKDEYLLCIVY